jgi:hypothetical protein
MSLARELKESYPERSKYLPVSGKDKFVKRSIILNYVNRSGNNIDHN